jgi:hypothetical protein
MIFRQEAWRLALKMTVCLVVAAGCAFVGCSSDNGTAPGTTKENLKAAFGPDAPQVNQGAKGGKKVFTKSIKQKLVNPAPAS